MPTHTPQTVSADERVGTKSATSLLPPHPEFMSNATKLAITLQRAAGTSNRPLQAPKIEQAALMETL